MMGSRPNRYRVVCRIARRAAAGRHTEFLVPLLVLSEDQIRIATDGTECSPGETIVGLIDEKHLAATGA